MADDHRQRRLVPALRLRLEAQEQGIGFDLRYRLTEVEDHRPIVETLKEWAA